MGAIFKQSQGWQLKQTPLTTNQNYNADKFKIEQFKMRHKVIAQFLQHFKYQTWGPSKIFPFRTIDSILMTDSSSSQIPKSVSPCLSTQLEKFLRCQIWPTDSCMSS